MIIALAAYLSMANSSLDALVATAWQDADKVFQKDLENDKTVGKKYSLQVEKEYKLSTDVEMQKRVQRIGGEMAAIANSTHAIATYGDKRFAHFDYSFKVIQQSDPNAFSLPGGFVYVHEGLLKFAESDDELAGVLAHEIAHAAFRHVAVIQREAGKLEALQIPLILAAVLLGKGGAAIGTTAMMTELTGTALVNGWSVDAEKAADYGGFQYMIKSNYDPTGMITFMERLAKEDRLHDQNWGIYRTHPPSKLRADALSQEMAKLGLPIRRSRVSPAYRAAVRPADNGAIEIMFGNRRLVTMTGNDALTRADAAVAHLNGFFDTVPELFEVRPGEDGVILGGREPLIAVTHEDAVAAKVSIADLQAATIKNIRSALFTLAYRVWDGR